MLKILIPLLIVMIMIAAPINSLFKKKINLREKEIEEEIGIFWEVFFILLGLFFYIGISSFLIIESIFYEIKCL